MILDWVRKVEKGYPFTMRIVHEIVRYDYDAQVDAQCRMAGPSQGGSKKARWALWAPFTASDRWQISPQERDQAFKALNVKAKTMMMTRVRERGKRNPPCCFVGSVSLSPQMI